MAGTSIELNGIPYSLLPGRYHVRPGNPPLRRLVLGAAFKDTADLLSLINHESFDGGRGPVDFVPQHPNLFLDATLDTRTPYKAILGPALTETALFDGTASVPAGDARGFVEYAGRLVAVTSRSGRWDIIVFNPALNRWEFPPQYPYRASGLTVDPAYGASNPVVYTYQQGSAGPIVTSLFVGGRDVIYQATAQPDGSWVWGSIANQGKGAVALAALQHLWLAQPPADLYFWNGSTFSTRYFVGSADARINALIPVQGRLIVAKESGIWAVDNFVLYQVFPEFEKARDPELGRAWAGWQGTALVGIRDELFAIAGLSAQAIGPSRPSQPEYPGFGRFVALAPDVARFYALTWDGSYVRLWSFETQNGSWHSLIPPQPAGSAGAGMYVSRLGGESFKRLWVSFGGRIYSARLPAWGRDPTRFSGYPLYYQDGGKLLLPWYRVFERVPKALINVTVFTEPWPAGYSLEVGYRTRPDDPFTSLGVLGGAGTERHVFAFPTGTVARVIQLEVAVSGPAAGTTTPVIKAVVLRFAPKADPVRVWQLGLKVADNPVTGSGVRLGYSAATLLNELWNAYAQRYPIVFKDIDGRQWNVIVVGLGEAQLLTEDGARIEYGVSITLQEVQVTAS